MQLLERKQSDGEEIFYIEHVLSEGAPNVNGTVLLIECTTKQQAITILKQLHATNDIYVETRDSETNLPIR